MLTATVLRLNSQVPFGGKPHLSRSSINNMLTRKSAGFKESGIGRELGEYALHNYTGVKAVHVNLHAPPPI